MFRSPEWVVTAFMWVSAILGCDWPMLLPSDWSPRQVVSVITIYVYMVNVQCHHNIYIYIYDPSYIWYFHITFYLFIFFFLLFLCVWPVSTDSNFIILVYCWSGISKVLCRQCLLMYALFAAIGCNGQISRGLHHWITMAACGLVPGLGSSIGHLTPCQADTTAMWDTQPHCTAHQGNTEIYFKSRLLWNPFLFFFKCHHIKEIKDQHEHQIQIN